MEFIYPAKIEEDEDGVDGHVKLSQKWSFGIEPLGN